jgi:isoleucyl-tRNA synthetase
LGVAIWTTTPWTIPANLAVAVNGDLTYAVVAVAGGNPFPYLLIAKDLRDRLSQVLGTDLTVKAELKGADLEGCTYRHPLQDQLPTDKRGDTSPVIVGGDYITTESGTGLVHTAPGHGQEDFQVGQRYGLGVLCPVDEKGTMTAEAGPFAGLNVLKDANPAVIKALMSSGCPAEGRPLPAQISLRLAHQKAHHLPGYRAVVRFGGGLPG